MRRIGCFVELHIEQGRGLVGLDSPVGLASSIMAHGRWRFTVTGQGNHAGTTAVADRHDPMIPAAAAILAARRAAGDADRATIGRLVPVPGGTNAIPSTVDFWLDARAPATTRTRWMVDDIIAATRRAVAAEGCELTVREESYGDTITFDADLRDDIAQRLGDVPQLPTGAGHDAGILAAHVPAAMLFVRNPTGISHAPQEYAEPGDCAKGAEALAAVLEHLAR